MTTDSTKPNDQITWCCTHKQHGEGPPAVYSISPSAGTAKGAFGCLHLTNEDRRALARGTVPEHLRLEYESLTAWEISGRFRSLAELIVEFKGADHPDLPGALEVLQNAEAAAIGWVAEYPALDLPSRTSQAMRHRAEGS
jgi:hypothetical protein